MKKTRIIFDDPVNPFPYKSTTPIVGIDKCLLKSVTAIATVYHDFDLGDRIISSEDCPVTISFTKKRVWWKPWTWRKKIIEYEVPNKTTINVTYIEGEPDE